MHRALGLRLLFVCIFLLSCGYAVAQQPGAAGEPSAAPKVEARGIAVGAPKAFDNRTLNLMLERLKGQLVGINVIDQTALAKAIGTVQGSRIQETSRALTVQGPGTPSVQSEHDTSSNLTPPATLPTTTDSTKLTTTTPGITPSAPTVPDVISAPSALTNLQYGMSASDLLNEQVDLTYEIINIQLLLDRSLSDRLLALTSGLTSRLQTVMGFNVTIDPPRDAENAEAVVEIKLRCKEAKECNADGLEPSLVAAMPQGTSPRISPGRDDAPRSTANHEDSAVRCVKNFGHRRTPEEGLYRGELESFSRAEELLKTSSHITISLQSPEIGPTPTPGNISSPLKTNPKFGGGGRTRTYDLRIMRPSL